MSSANEVLGTETWIIVLLDSKSILSMGDTNKLRDIMNIGVGPNIV